MIRLIILALCWLGAQAHSTGAPNGDACRNLYPNHGVDKQYGHSSYRVSVLRRYNDTSFVVTIYSPTDTFLGFIMQARLFSDREMLVNGVFSTDEYTKALDCLGGYQNTLTHSNSFPKYKIESIWTPPKNFASDIVFRATVVQSKTVFWTAIDSDPIDITSNSISSLLDPSNRVKTFNIHNPQPPTFGSVNPPVPSGFVVNKDNPSSPYHVALPSSALNPQSPFLTNSHLPLVQSFPNSKFPETSNRDSMFYMDYNICSRKLCMGLPVNCLRKRNCIMILTISYLPFTDSTVEFEIIADHNMAFSNKRLSSFGMSTSLPTTSAYYSMALSHDKIMGNDSVTDCALLSDGRPHLLHSINIGKSNEELSDTEFHGATVVNTTYTNGILYCKWRKRRRFTLRGTRYDLKDNKYYMMISYGRLTSISSFRRKEPHLDKTVSQSAVDIRQVGYISAHSKMFLIKLHAGFMVAAWIGFVSIGIMTARYFKPLWISHSMFGVRIWFAIHRSCMLASLLFVFIGFVSIFLYADGISFGTHQIFGFVAILAVLINPISAVFRPDCDSSKRWIFNWIHWLIGNTGHICAITAIFLAYQMTTIRLQPAYLWSIAFYLFFHLTVHSLLELYFCNCRHNKESSDITKHGPEPSPHTSQRIDSLADTSFLRYFFALYSAVIFAFVITIIGIILFN